MKTSFSIIRMLNIYRSIWQTSSEWFITLPVIAISITLSFMIFLPIDNFLVSQLLTFISVTTISQIMGLKLIQTAIYNNGFTFFTIPSRTEERLIAMLMTLATNLVISIAAYYIGFILLLLAKSFITEIFQISPFIQTESTCLLNPLNILPQDQQLSYYSIGLFICMLITLPALCFLAAFLCTIITSNQWIKSSIFILLYICSTVIFIFFMRHLFSKTDSTLWQTVFLSPYLYILLAIGIIGASFYKLKTKQIL